MLQGAILAGPQKGVSLRLPLGTVHEIPALGFGTYRLPKEKAAGAVSYAIDCGFRHIDCAKVYGNQAEIGEGIAQALKKNNIRREDIFVTGKLWPTDQHPDRVEGAIRETLAQLRLDHLDLFLVHWPVAWKNTGKWESDEDKYPQARPGVAAIDHDVKLIDTWKAMELLVDKRLTKCIGLSNSGSDEFDALRHVRHRPVTNQIEGHPALQQHVLKARMVRDGMLPTCYCPLAMPTRFTPPEYEGICKTRHMEQLAEVTGFTPARMILSWAVDNHNAVIVKAQDPKHIKENAKVSTGMLSEPQRRMVQAYEQMYGSARVINPNSFRDDGKPFFPC